MADCSNVILITSYNNSSIVHTVWYIGSKGSSCHRERELDRELGRAGETWWLLLYCWLWCNERREARQWRSRSRVLVVAGCAVLWRHCRPEYWSEEAAPHWGEERRGEHQGLEIMVLSLPVLASRPLHSAPTTTSRQHSTVSDSEVKWWRLLSSYHVKGLCYADRIFETFNQ